MHKSLKPVRKCHGCKLNLGDHCGIFPNPHKQWEAEECKGRKNDELYRQYLNDQAQHAPDSGKEERRKRARQAKTEPHHDGARAHQSPFAGG